MRQWLDLISESIQTIEWGEGDDSSSMRDSRDRLRRKVAILIDKLLADLQQSAQ